MLTSAEIKGLINECKPETISAELPEKILALIKIKKEVLDLVRDVQQEEQEHQSQLIAFQRRKAIIQEKCSHPFEKYYSDPSGGSDSFYRCETCGKEHR